MHTTCSHARYRLTCEQFEQLRDRAGGRCEVCQQLEQYAPGRKLLIDHEKPLGFWAVRGLLCNNCNHDIDADRITGPEVDAYRVKAWYLTLPYAGTVQPEDEDDGPLVDLVTAPAMLAAAAQDAESARQRNQGDWRLRREQLIDLMRAADRAGMRQVDMIKATGWSRERIYAATRERRAQPALPRT